MPFRAAIDAGVGSIMTAHLLVPALDAEPATLSRPIITGLLRDELGYDGLVISDALEMRAVADLVGVEEAAVRSIAAGSDALCIGHDLHEEAVERIHSALVTRSPTADSLPRASRRRPTVSTAHAHSDERRGADAGRRHTRRARGHCASRARHISTVRRSSSSSSRRRTSPRGEAQHGLAEILGAPGVVLTGASPSFPQIPPDRVPVVVLRDAGRHPWQVEIATRLAAERPETVLVETGLPGVRPPGAAGTWSRTARAA